MRVIREALGSPPELAPYEDPDIALDKRDEIRRALEPLVGGLTTDEVVNALRTHDVWCAPVLSYDEMLNNPAVQHLDPVVEIEHPRAGSVRLLKNPIGFGVGEPVVHRCPPEVGEQTAEILAELGYEESDIAQLHDDGVT